MCFGMQIDVKVFSHGRLPVRLLDIPLLSPPVQLMEPRPAHPGVSPIYLVEECREQLSHVGRVSPEELEARAAELLAAAESVQPPAARSAAYLASADLLQSAACQHGAADPSGDAACRAWLVSLHILTAGLQRCPSLSMAALLVCSLCAAASLPGAASMLPTVVATLQQRCAASDAG